ncbi:MAG: hypothetical protein IT437_09750 [Phycisphaerales bacterium]|nr:hypothetical protein [Phycisphaerales bacterium]
MAAVSSALPAQVIEGFEHGNEGLYAFAGGLVDNMSLTAGAAHDGALGAEFSSIALPAFRTRFSLATAPGASYAVFVRVRGAWPQAGRLYLGVGASPGGAWSAVFAPNTSEIQLQDNTGYGFVTVAATPVAIQNNTWYALVLDWGVSGDMRVRLMDGAMTATLATTPVTATGLLVPGGLSLRGFGSPQTPLDLDTITKLAATCYPDCNGDGVLTLSDFGCFTTKFALHDPYADCNGDGVLNLADLGCFSTKFGLGCN